MNARQSIFTMLNQLMAQLDRDSVVELLELYFENSRKHLDAIETAVEKNDLKFLSFEAHGLKSSSANLGAAELSQICLKIEKSTRIDQETTERVQELRRLFDETQGIMQDWKLTSLP